MPERNVAIIVAPPAGYEAHGNGRRRYLPNVQTHADGTAWD